MAVGADHVLLDTARRRLRQPAGWLGIVLHLSRLAPPAPRPHHRRIARALMEDTAQRHDGQVFATGGGDLVLLCRAGEGGRSGRMATAADLPGVLARLLRLDAPDPPAIVSLWPLDTEGEALLAYALAGVAAAPTSAAPNAALPRVEPGHTSGPDSVDAIATLIGGTDSADLLKRQTAVLLAGEAMRPLFRVVTFSMAALESRLAMAGAPDADAYLFRHLAERLDRRMLALLGSALGDGGPLDLLRAPDPPPHLTLTLAGLASPDFATLATALAGSGRRFGVEVALLEVVADPLTLADARTRLAALGAAFVLGGVTPLTLRLARIAAFAPDLVKLDWQPRLAQSEEDAEPVRRLLRDLGPERVVLHRAETEAAVRWGFGLGIRRFQGRHIDAMLGAARLGSCAHAGGCTLRQCIERAAAAGAGGRSLCRNHALLDTGVRVAA